MFFFDWGNYGLNLIFIILTLYFLFIINTNIKTTYFNNSLWLKQILVSSNIGIYLKNLNKIIKEDITIHNYNYKIHKTIAAILFFITTSLLFFLCYHFIISNFFYINVLDHSHNSQPFFYKIGALWGNHEGSMLLWLWILTLYNFLFSVLSVNSLLYYVYTNTLIINHIIIYFFVLFILYTSNPFLSTFFYSGNGVDLNPILQDPVLLIHPPLIYFGYLGFVINYSLSIAYLMYLIKILKITINDKVYINKRDDNNINNGIENKDYKINITDWIQKEGQIWGYLKFFNIISWTFLTFGIFLGSWWAYYELGWGGWWFWDPVENASLIPWLFSTAYLHLVLRTYKKKIFIKESLFLGISLFLTSLTGTFFVRSGILNSVHSFANDSSRGVFLLFMLGLFSLAYLILLYYVYLNNKLQDLLFKKPLFQGRYKYEITKNNKLERLLNKKIEIKLPKIFKYNDYRIWSTDGFILINNLFLVSFGIFILIGTIAPLFFAYWFHRDISLGNTFYNNTLIPIFIPFLIIMIYGPFIRYLGTFNIYNNNENGNNKYLKFNITLIYCFIFTGILFTLYSTFTNNELNSFNFLNYKLIYLNFLDEYINIIQDMSYMTRLTCILSCLLIYNLIYFWYYKKITYNILIPHLGLGIIVAAIAISTNFYQEINQIVNYGDSIILNDFVYNLRHFNYLEAINYQSVYANVIVFYKNNFMMPQMDYGLVSSMFPEKRLYFIQNIFTTKASIHTNLFYDLYVVIGDGNIKTGWYIKLFYQPALSFLWLGSIVMVLGGVYIIYNNYKELKK